MSPHVMVCRRAGTGFESPLYRHAPIVYTCIDIVYNV